MQPYFFPYIGYFQLMRHVDRFVIYDDVQYMKGGWINRNRILHDGKPQWITVPVRRDRLTLPINQRYYLLDEHEIKCIKRRLWSCYSNSDRFDEAIRFINGLLESYDLNVATFNTRLLVSLAARLGITCELLISSELPKRENLTGQERVIDICRLLGADNYLNPIGGAHLYEASAFEKAGVRLEFIRTRPLSYQQAGQPHVPFLSIIDVLMFNSEKDILSLMNQYDIIEPGQAAEYG